MWFKKKRIYLDYASATPVDTVAFKVMRDAERTFANPSGLHQEGHDAKKLLENARTRIANLLQCKSREFIFTSGLTEANNLAIVGFAHALEHKRLLSGSHWIVSSIEHPAVLASFSEVERMGGTISFVEPDMDGRISAEILKNALKKETVCVSVGWANSETGMVQPLREISHVIRAHELHKSTHILFHSDAGQAPVYIHPHVRLLGVDSMAFGANKMQGPHGIGGLFVLDSTWLAPVLFGGGQEKRLRPGTESPALALGFAAAFEAVTVRRESERVRLSDLRDTLSKGILASYPRAQINTQQAHALPHMLNVSFVGQSGEYVALFFDKEGIAVSTKSSCREGEEGFSHVLRAQGFDEERSRSSIRFSLGTGTSRRDIRRVVEVCKRISEL